MRIVTINFSSQPEFHAVNYLHTKIHFAAIAAGHQPTLGYLTGGEISSNQTDNDFIQWRQESRLIRRKGFMPVKKNRWRKSLRQSFASLLPDIVITDGFTSSSWVADALAGRAVKVLTVIHGTPRKCRRFNKIVKTISKHQWPVICCSSQVRAEVLAAYPSFSVDQVSVIENAVDVSEHREKLLSRAHARLELNLAQDSYVVGALGRLEQSKGHDLLIRAFAKLLKLNPCARLVILGEGRYRQELEALIEELDLHSFVYLPGWVDHGAKLLPALDIAVMPSRREPFGLALLEYLMASVPAIYSDIPPFIDIMATQPFSFKSGSCDELAKQLIVASELDPLKRQEVIAYQDQRVSSHYDISRYTSQFMQLIETGTFDSI